jgi:predicted MFS family arabinose efflux permease
LIDLGRQVLSERPVDRKGFDLSYAITLVAVFFTGLASAGLLVLKPLIVGALIDDYHFSPSQSGFVAGIEMAGIGVSALIVAAIGGRWNRRFVILAGATLGILGSVVPVLSTAYMPILLSRLMAGIGSGLIASIVLAVIGTTRDPDRTFGLYYIFTFAGSSLLVPTGVWVLARFHVPGGYILLALLLAAVYVTAHRIPAAFSGLHEDSKRRSLPRFPMKPAVWSLGLSLVFWFGLGGVWAFVERLGVQAGLSQVAIGSVLTVGPLASIAGALTASVLHTRFGRTPLLAASIGLATLSVAMLGWTSSLAGFGIAVLLFSYIWPLFLAYLGGAMSMLDPAGRIIAMSVTSQTIGMAFGPAVAGVIAVHFGYVAIAVLGLACFAVAFALLVPLFITLRAHA